MPTMKREGHDAERLKALGHPVRLGIVQRLAREPLRVLREAGLVTTRRRGTQICYSVEPGAVRALGELLTGLAAPSVAAA
jgi:ArsR family transcriptional regulator